MDEATQDKVTHWLVDCPRPEIFNERQMYVIQWCTRGRWHKTFPKAMPRKKKCFGKHGVACVLPTKQVKNSQRKEKQWMKDESVVIDVKRDTQMTKSRQCMTDKTTVVSETAAVVDKQAILKQSIAM